MKNPCSSIPSSLSHQKHPIKASQPSYQKHPFNQSKLRTTTTPKTSNHSKLRTRTSTTTPPFLPLLIPQRPPNHLPRRSLR